MAEGCSVGDLALTLALSMARNQANAYRRLQLAHGEPSAEYARGAFYAFGLAAGVQIAAEIHLHADRDRAMAVANEIRFLAGRYLDPRR